jgi:hypothetical protein
MTHEGVDRAGRDAAARRVERTMARAQHVQLTSLILGRPSDEVDAARDLATDAAIMHGRRELLEKARNEATGWVLQAFAQRGYSGTWAATDVAVSVARPRDRAAVAAALADAISADVVEDLVDASTVETLRSNWEVLDGGSSIPEAGALSGLTSALVGPPGHPGSQRLAVAGVVFLLGLLFLAGAQPVGLVFVLAAAWVLRNALLGRAP